MPLSSAATWIVAAYRVPATPSTARVAAWRGLRELGAIVLGPTVCALPAPASDDRRFETIVQRIIRAGGSVEQLAVSAFTPEAEARLRERYNAGRDLQYRELARRATGLVRRIDADVRDGAVGFDRLERHESDLVKIRRAIRKVVATDLFDARGRVPATAAVDQAAAALDDMARRTMPHVGDRPSEAVA